MDNTQDSSSYRVGDIIVGHSDPGRSVYTATGARTSQNGTIEYGGAQELQKRAKELVTSISRAGGIPIQTNTPATKSGKKKSNRAVKMSNFSVDAYEDMRSSQPQNYFTEQPKTLTTVQFENSFGKIKAKIEHLVEHDMALMLVFSDEDSIVFEPKVGETLTIYTEDRRSLEVYYPGVTFDWPGNTKKLMILFKLPEENQE